MHDPGWLELFPRLHTPARPESPVIDPPTVHQTKQPSQPGRAVLLPVQQLPDSVHLAVFEEPKALHADSHEGAAAQLQVGDLDRAIR